MDLYAFLPSLWLAASQLVIDASADDPLVGNSGVFLLSLEALLETWDLLRESPLPLLLLLSGLVV